MMAYRMADGSMAIVPAVHNRQGWLEPSGARVDRTEPCMLRPTNVEPTCTCTGLLRESEAFSVFEEAE